MNNYLICCSSDCLCYLLPKYHTLLHLHINIKGYIGSVHSFNIYSYHGFVIYVINCDEIWSWEGNVQAWQTVVGAMTNLCNWLQQQRQIFFIVTSFCVQHLRLIAWLGRFVDKRINCNNSLACFLFQKFLF